MGTKYDITDVFNPSKIAFIKLETMVPEQYSTRKIHILCPKDETCSFKIGRSHNSDIKLDDVSISRLHAVLKYADHKFFIEDSNSKFGTTTKIKSLEINSNVFPILQYGRTIIVLSIKSFDLTQYFI